MPAPDAMALLLSGAEPGGGAGVQPTRVGELDKMLGTAVILKPGPVYPDETRKGGFDELKKIGSNFVNEATKPVKRPI